jgi:hypothetical protein
VSNLFLLDHKLIQIIFKYLKKKINNLLYILINKYIINIIMSYYLNENFEPIFKNNNEIKFKGHITKLKEQYNEKCDKNEPQIESGKICMNIGDEEDNNILVNNEKLYSGYCLPQNVINSINNNKINSKNELKSLNQCANNLGDAPIYIGYKKSENPSLYGLKMNIKCQNGDNYICPIFNELSKKLLNKCESNNGEIKCELGNLNEDEKRELEICLNNAGDECGINNKIKVSYKCNNNNIVKEVNTIEDIKIDCKNEDEKKKELCIGTNSEIEYNNYKMSLNECSNDSIPIYYNPNHKIDNKKIKEDKKNFINNLYTQNYEEAKSNLNNYEIKKKELNELESYANENGIDIVKVFETLDSSNNTNTCNIQEKILEEDISNINSKIDLLKEVIEKGDYYKDSNELDSLKSKTDNINRQIESYKANNEKKKSIISLLNKILLILTIALLITIVYYGIKKGVIPKNTQNKINNLLKNQMVIS